MRRAREAIEKAEPGRPVVASSARSGGPCRRSNGLRADILAALWVESPLTHEVLEQRELREARGCLARPLGLITESDDA